MRLLNVVLVMRCAAKGATIASVRIFDGAGRGTTSSIVKALELILEARLDPTGDYYDKRWILNLSSDGGKCRCVNDALNNLVEAGVVVVVAAGNSNEDACNRSPASAVSETAPSVILVCVVSGAYGTSHLCLLPLWQ